MSGWGSSSISSAPPLLSSESHQSIVGQTGWAEAPHLPGPDLQTDMTQTVIPLKMSSVTDPIQNCICKLVNFRHVCTFYSNILKSLVGRCFQYFDQMLIRLEIGDFLKWKALVSFFLFLFSFFLQKKSCINTFTSSQTVMYLPLAFSALLSFPCINDRKGQRRQSWTRHQSKAAGWQEGRPYPYLWQECRDNTVSTTQRKLLYTK